MMGFRSNGNLILHAELEKEIKIKKRRREYRPAFLRYVNRRWMVSPIGWHGSGDLFSTTKANCFLIIKEYTDILNIGDLVEVMLIDGFC